VVGEAASQGGAKVGAENYRFLVDRKLHIAGELYECPSFGENRDMSPDSSERRRSHGLPHFEESYTGTPPWDIGRPQPIFLALAEAGELRGRVLDVGCGTGEHVLMAARMGLEATGIDFTAAAIALAQAKAREQGIAARFLVCNALKLATVLAELGGPFDTVLDSGLFHVFDDDDRRAYVESLKAAIAPGGRYFMACFSDRQPGDWGPRRVTEGEIRASFSDGWRVDSIEPAEFELHGGPPNVLAWLARITRI